ncbi:MAG: putative toxin-antitoxin system toxin component, PIN family [Candidatus Velamenicoccus archaeovorus]
MRAVLDPNVIISGLLSPNGVPATLLKEWERGAFELVVSDLLLDELERALAYPKLRKHISREEAAAVLEWLARSAIVAPDPDEPPPVRSPDPGDDYLIALAAAQDAVLVSGDRHLLGLSGEAPVLSPAEFSRSWLAGGP